MDQINWLRVVEGATTGKFAVEELSTDVWMFHSGWFDTQAEAESSADEYYSTITGQTASTTSQRDIDTQGRILVGDYHDKDGTTGYVPVIAE